MRKILAAIIVSVVLLFNMTAVFAVSPSVGSVFEDAQLESGLIKVSYQSDNNKKLKVMVEKDGQKIHYNLRNDGTAESYPLQFGNGDYKISLMENTEGNKYKYLLTQNVKLEMEDQKEVYLTSIQNINWNQDMAAIKKAKELTKGINDDQKKVKVIYEYIVNNLKYDYEKIKNLPSDYLPDIDATLASNKGICYDYASTFAAMLRSVEIPTKLVKGYAKGINGYHAWNEVYNSEKGVWEIYDTTYDAQMKALKGKYSIIKESSVYTKVNEY